MNIGDIHWVDLPGADGRAQFGRRPAMVIQDEKFAGKLPTVLVVPLTSTQKALRFAGTTLIVATPESSNKRKGGLTAMPSCDFDFDHGEAPSLNAFPSKCM